MTKSTTRPSAVNVCGDVLQGEENRGETNDCGLELVHRVLMVRLQLPADQWKAGSRNEMIARGLETAAGPYPTLHISTTRLPVFGVEESRPVVLYIYIYIGGVWSTRGCVIIVVIITDISSPPPRLSPSSPFPLPTQPRPLPCSRCQPPGC